MSIEKALTLRCPHSHLARFTLRTSTSLSHSSKLSLNDIFRMSRRYFYWRNLIQTEYQKQHNVYLLTRKDRILFYTFCTAFAVGVVLWVPSFINFLRGKGRREPGSEPQQ